MVKNMQKGTKRIQVQLQSNTTKNRYIQNANEIKEFLAKEMKKK